MLLPHEVLGVSPDADVITIKRVFRTLAKEWHPDRNRDPRATVRFRELLGAYRHLIHARTHRVPVSRVVPTRSCVVTSSAVPNEDFSWEDRRPIVATAYPARLARIVIAATVGAVVLMWGSAFLSQL